ncbi:hypothetical protein SAMN04489720_2139 [Agrococcus jejuensis]|uniref:Uncharacterized protein n=2 Tax=Agrococcus jejuensis TaxID=399736 RepID=A0A1G8EPM4_9MICO|nr:hypothetical protein SAMN04489720_2139 [Agrococcus jejuensis]
MPDFEPPEPVPEPAVGEVADAAVDEAPATATEAPAAEPEPARRDLRALWRRIRVPAIAFAVGVVVAVAGSIAAGVVQDRTRHDDVVAAIDAYVAAIESDGDRTAATGQTPSLDDAVASSVLLYASIRIAVPPQVVCDEPRIGADLALVDCRVRVQGRIEPTTIALEHTDMGWTVARGLEVPVRIQSGALLVDAVGGVPLDEDVARGERAVWLLPGRYDVDAHAPAQLAVQVDGLVVSPSGGAVRWESDTAATVDADVRAAALAFVDACAAAPADGCPVIQDRDPVEPFEAFAVVGRIALDDRYAMTYDVSVRRPVEQPSEFLLITVRVDFGEDLDRYDVAVVPTS